MAVINGGYYMKPREAAATDCGKIAHSTPAVREIWDYLLRAANYKDNPKTGIKRGQIFTTYGEIAEALSWYVGYRKVVYSKSQCEKAMKTLTKAALVETTKTTRGLVITICKYDTYADPKSYEDATEDFTKDLRSFKGADTIQKKGEEIEKGKELLGTNVPVKTKVLTDDKELKKSFEKVDIKDLGQVTTFIRANKPHFTEPYTALWNLFAVKHGFAQVSKITDKRRQKIRTRMKDADFDMLAILAKAKDSEMLHEGSWFTFDFIIENSDNYVKIMEGKYSKSLNSKPATTTDPELSEATKQMLQRKNQSV